MKENAPGVLERLAAADRLSHRGSRRAARAPHQEDIDPLQAETVQLIFRLAREGNGSSGPMGVKSITKHLNGADIRTRDGGRWGVGAVHNVLTRTTYIGRHRFNTKSWNGTEPQPARKVAKPRARTRWNRLISCSKITIV